MEPAINPNSNALATTGMPMGEVSEALTVTLKTTPPGQPGVVELLAASDTPIAG
jgi:hypothetical protein